jgi:hypothetical protein
MQEEFDINGTPVVGYLTLPERVHCPRILVLHACGGLLLSSRSVRAARRRGFRRIRPGPIGRIESLHSLRFRCLLNGSDAGKLEVMRS